MDVRSLISMYVNDTMGYMCNQHDFDLFMATIDVYTKVSGVKLNLNKSSIIVFREKFECDTLEVIKEEATDRLLEFMLGTEESHEVQQKQVMDKFIGRCSV